VTPAISRRTLLGTVLAVLIVAAVVALGRTVKGVRVALAGGGRTTISHAVVVSRMEAVSKLVTSETTIRDVVVYENTRLGSTKRALVVVTGKALVGIDLAANTAVDIDETARRIRIRVPRARLVGIDIIDLKTYDEDRGLWNPFRPADRDTILLLARQRLRSAAADLSVREHAEESARRLLTGLFAPDGYAVDVVFEPFLSPPAAQ
jgi:hypothetical protein